MFQILANLSVGESLLITSIIITVYICVTNLIPSEIKLKHFYHLVHFPELKKTLVNNLYTALYKTRQPTNKYLHKVHRQTLIKSEGCALYMKAKF